MVGESHQPRKRGRPPKSQFGEQAVHSLKLLISNQGPNLFSPDRMFWPMEVDPTDSEIVWRWPPEIEGITKGQVFALPGFKRTAIFDFTRLSDASTEDVKTFAREWGPLLNYVQFGPPEDLVSPIDGLDKPRVMGMPVSAPQRQMPTDGPIREPLSTWKLLSRRAEAILGIIADLRAEDREREKGYEVSLVRKGDLDLIYPVVWPEPWQHQEYGEQWAVYAEEPHGRLFLELGNWLANAPTQVAVPFAPRHWSEIGLTANASTLASRLALELAGAVTNNPGPYRCTYCERPYWPEGRRPSEDSGLPHFCKWCRKKGRRMPRTKVF